MKNNLTGVRFGRLVAIEPTGEELWGCLAWKCSCDCGNVHIVASNTLKSGLTRSCGCLAKEMAKDRSTKHNEYGTPTYASWASMIQRCTNPKSTSFKRYGALGISVCDEWRKYENFKSDMGDRPSGKSLDRIDPFKSYNKTNCRWASSAMQRRNRKTQSTTFDVAQKIRSLRSSGWMPKAIAEELGVSIGVVGGVVYMNTLSAPE